MARFAKVINNKVIDIIVAEQDFINTLSDKDFYIECGINKEYPAQIGGLYDGIKKIFILPKPYNSWILNNTTSKWEAPTPMPNDGKSYGWVEETTSWEEVV
jgi:hypothetical protein